jgi:poly(3-hydroxybutyrate) depolymerase
MYKFFKEIYNIKSPQWYMPNTVVLNRPAYKLRFFQAGHHTLLLLPPQAGHYSCIADYKNGMSLVQHYCNKGYSVYTVEWKSCSFARRNESLDDLVEQVLECVQYIGVEVNLVGLCQAGWLATMFTSEYPEMVDSLTIGGSPIDFDAGDGYIKRLVKLFPQDFYKWLVWLNGGLMPGSLILWGFKNMHWWDRYVDDYVKLWKALDEPEELDRIRHFRNWYESTQDIAGNWYLQAVDKLFRQNELITGKLGYDLANIRCPVRLIAGEADDITPPPQILNMNHYIKSREISATVIPKCGHIGLFIKSSALPYW